jgi:hypothetical protein
MGISFQRRPSPAMIVAVVALSFALVGTAIAGTDAATRAITKSKVKKIVKKQIKKRAGKLSVANANTVGGLPPNALNRAAFATAEEESFGDGTLLTTTIQAPIAGTLLINAHAEAINFVGSDEYVCFIELNNAFVPGSGSLRTDGNSGDPDEDCDTVGAATVPAGTYSVDFEGSSIEGDMSWFQRTLTAEFVPFNGAGARAAEATELGGNPPALRGSSGR